MTLHQINGVEIFAAGTHNGDPYSIADLDEMVSAFGKAGYRVPIKLGHDEKSGDRAFGWIGKIYRKGEKLLADFVDLPSSVYALIKEKAYDAVSSEIFWDIVRGGQMFHRALKAVALLGAETPAVAGLRPISSSFSLPVWAARTYSFPKERTTMAATDPGQQIVEMTKAYQHAHPTIGWSAAFEAIKASPEGRAALRAYGQKRVVIEEDDFDLYDGERAKETIHDFATNAMKRDKGLTYSDAVRKILAENENLRRAYAAGR